MRGDQDAFGSLAAAVIGRLSGAASLMLRDPDAADDAVQEALVRAWRDLPGLRDPARFEAWLQRIMVRACHDQLRQRRRESANEREQDPGKAMAADEIAMVADRDELMAAMGGLSNPQRAAVVLHYFVGMSHSQIAEVMGDPVGTVKARLRRSLGYLQAALAAEARLGVGEERRA